MIKIKAITIIRLSGHPDKVEILVEGPSPWPELHRTSPGDYEPFLHIECRRGYAESWLEGMGFDPSIAKIIP